MHTKNRGAAFPQVVFRPDELFVDEGDVLLVGDGASEIGTKGVKSGVWYASSILRPYNEGYVEAQYAIAAVRGGSGVEIEPSERPRLTSRPGCDATAAAISSIRSAGSS